ncbi:hypothetical protein HDU78_003535 [Chytriomyces hyalinus]|nr:hypothetical protein HDU77_000823 [Chytriomyces hyalinus]KAJ3238429.1 hypothetical protein HDU78_003535 [Chytriomyces hyalinus]
MAPINVEDLMRDLDLSLNEFNADLAGSTPTVAEVLAQCGTNAMTGHLSHASGDEWVRVYVVLGNEAMHLFPSADSHETALEHMPLIASTAVYENIPTVPLAFEVADTADKTRSWVLLAPTKTAKNTWVSKLKALTRRDSGHEDASRDNLEWINQQRKAAQAAMNPPHMARSFSTERRAPVQFRAPTNLPRLNSDVSSTSSSSAAAAAAMQQQLAAYNQNLTSWKATSDVQGLLRRGSESTTLVSPIMPGAVGADVRSIAASEASSVSYGSLGGIRGGGIFGREDDAVSMHSSHSGSERTGGLGLFGGGNKSKSQGRKKENQLFSNMEDSGLF